MKMLEEIKNKGTKNYYNMQTEQVSLKKNKSAAEKKAARRGL